jgi:hypothetical protein
VHLFHYHLVTSDLRNVEARYVGRLGFDLIARSGRIGDDRLRATSPRFMARYDARRRALSFPPPLAGEG